MQQGQWARQPQSVWVSGAVCLFRCDSPVSLLPVVGRVFDLYMLSFNKCSNLDRKIGFLVSFAFLSFLVAALSTPRLT